MTTPVPIGKLLKEYLDHLDKERLKEFQWHLVQIQIEGSRPIPRSKLENATREETVDNLVEAFGEDGAVEWTVDTFFQMNLNDLAHKLVQAKMDQSRIDGEKQKAFKTVRQFHNSSIERIMTQSYFEEKQIMNDFKRRRALLHEEERTKRAALRKQTRQKIHMKNLIADMTEDILRSDIKANRRFRANKRFTETRATQKIRMETTMRNLQKEDLRLEVLKIWNDIKQTSVVVDPKTASSRLAVSDHQTEMKFNDTQQPCPGYPERSTSYQQNLQKSLKRRRVEQDYEDGKGSVHDPDNNTSILTHEDTFPQSPVDDYPECNVMIVPVVIPYEAEDDDEDVQRPS